MKKREVLVALLALAAYLALRGPALLAPFILPFEAAFQESIALHHAPGVAQNHFLSVIAAVGGEKFYHVSHPPLLQLIYAQLYRSPLGAREAITRFFSLGLMLAAAFLWRSALGRARLGWTVFFLALFLPIPFLLATTTNYEPLSIFMISLIARLALARRPRLAALLPAATVGALVDWPVYLAVPVLIVVKWRDQTARRRLFLALGWQAAIFIALQLYQAAVSGEAAFFSHAPSRANPLALLAPDLWSELLAHVLALMGGPLTLATAAALAAAVIANLGAGRRLAAARDDIAAGHAGVEVERFFYLFPAVLILAAPRLVSRHEVYLLYLAPAAALAFRRVLASSRAPALGLAALLLLCGLRDFTLGGERNPAYFGMADRLRRLELKTAFASAAVGHWRYYDRIETVHPVSARTADWLKTHQPDLIHLDVRGREVAHYGGADLADYRLIFAIPGEEVYLRKDLAPAAPHYLTIEPAAGADAELEPASTFIMTGRGRDCPAGTWIQTRPFYGANITGCRVSSYAIRQRPGPGGSALTIGLEGVAGLELRPAIVHAFPFARSDGVSFFATASFPDRAGGKARRRLLYARALGDNDAAATALPPLQGAETLTLATTPGPRMNSSFDDAYWLEPIVEDQAAAAAPPP